MNVRRLARRLHELVSHDASRRAHLARREATQHERRRQLVATLPPDTPPPFHLPTDPLVEGDVCPECGRGTMRDITADSLHAGSTLRCTACGHGTGHVQTNLAGPA